MIIFAAIFYVFLILLSVVITKDKYNMFLMSNVIFLTTTFLFPFLGQLLEIDIITSKQGMIMYIMYFFVFFVCYILGRKSVSFSDVAEVSEYKDNLYVKFVLRFSLIINLIFVAYSVVKYGVQGAFINPREVYTTTRTGSGQIYYVAAIFFSIYVLLGLFVLKRKWLHFIICIVFALPYGTKGKIFFIVIYNLVYFLFVHKNRLYYRRPKYFIAIIIGLPLIMVSAFWYTSAGLDQYEILKFMIGYGNEYENDFHQLINHFSMYFPHGHLNGKILFGDTFYPFIPRVLWPGKPEIFGDLYLSYNVFPEATIANTGAPSFGPIGQPFADFGFVGGLIQIIIEQSILGYLLGMYEVKCLNKPSIINFFLLITLAFGGLISLASTDRIVITAINIFLVLLIFWPLKFTFKLKSTRKDIIG